MFILECQPNLLRPNRKLNLYDVMYFIPILVNFGPYLTYIVSLMWNTDGLYWVIEDISPDPFYRDFWEILLFLVIRTCLLLPGYLEVTRLLFGIALSFLTLQLSVTGLVSVLSVESARKYPRMSSSQLLSVYSRFRILSRIFEQVVTKGMFIGVNLFYFVGIQSAWVCVRGWNSLDLTVYFFFTACMLCVVIATVVGLPLIAMTGDIIANLPKRIRLRMWSEFIRTRQKSFKSKVLWKQSVAIHSITYSFGGIFPIGKLFARLFFDSALQTLFSMVLLFGF